MFTTLVLSLLLALAAALPQDSAGINPVQHSEARASQGDETPNVKAPNPVQHSE